MHRKVATVSYGELKFVGWEERGGSPGSAGAVDSEQGQYSRAWWNASREEWASAYGYAYDMEHRQRGVQVPDMSYLIRGADWVEQATAVGVVGPWAVPVVASGSTAAYGWTVAVGIPKATAIGVGIAGVGRQTVNFLQSQAGANYQWVERGYQFLGGYAPTGDYSPAPYAVAGVVVSELDGRLPGGPYLPH